MASGAEYDSLNIHSLYKKFPDWVLEQEEDNDPKHLKQVIQIVSSYFDDLYGKITEVSKYKHNKNTTDTQKIYPFYDRILSSTGFDVSDLFTNLDIIETISSRNDKNIFDEDIQRVKNQIYQNIYNNLMSILRSKGTKKSLKAFLRSYGISENIVKINLYSNNGTYTISDKSELTTVKKKTLLLQNYASVYVTSSAYLTTSTGSITYENCLLFPKPLEATAPYTSSLFGLSFSDSARTYEPFEAYAYLHNDTSGSKFYFYTGSSLIGSSSYFQEIYDNTPWNFVIRLKPYADTTNIDYINSTFIANDIIELSGTNYGNGFERSFCISASLDRIVNRFAWHSTSPYINFYVGAKNLNRTSTGIYPTNIKSIYCNFWDSYLSDDVIISHNRDITNYGVDE